jgi:phage-related protein
MVYQQLPKVLTAAFGDGYVQRTPEGINSMPRIYKLEWNPCTPTEADYMVGFFEAHAGAKPFWWQSPRDTTPRKYVCSEWSRSEPQWNASAVMATFIEDFSLEV